MKKVLMAMALVAAFAGCEDKKPEVPKPEVYPAEGNAYMKDPAFKAKCEDAVKLRNRLLVARQKIVEARKALLAKHGGDEAKAAADPEWAKLATELKLADQKLVDGQTAARDLVRDRMRQAAEDSKRISTGAAVPKK